MIALLIQPCRCGQRQLGLAGERVADCLQPGGFPDHPHRGIETVTVVLDGYLWHADNRGNSGILGADDVQWMTDGRGIVHAELPKPGAMSHTLQLWLNLPAERKMVESHDQDVLASDRLVVEDDHATIRLLAAIEDGYPSLSTVAGRGRAGEH